MTSGSVLARDFIVASPFVSIASPNPVLGSIANRVEQDHHRQDRRHLVRLEGAGAEEYIQSHYSSESCCLQRPVLLVA